jgi:hypothetical protein
VLTKISKDQSIESLRAKYGVKRRIVLRDCGDQAEPVLAVVDLQTFE